MAQTSAMPVCPMAETCKKLDEKTPAQRGDVDPRSRIHDPWHIDRRLAIRVGVAGGHRVHPGGWRHARDG